MISEFIHNVMEHPGLALFFLLCIAFWACTEIYRWLHPMRDARRHWSGEYGFRATGGRSDTRGLR
jgi:hypothetical protein